MRHERFPRIQSREILTIEIVGAEEVKENIKMFSKVTVAVFSHLEG